MTTARALPTTLATVPRKKLSELVRAGANQATDRVTAARREVSEALERFSARVLRLLAIPSKSEIAALNARLAQLESDIARLGGQKAAPAAKSRTRRAPGSRPAKK